MCIDGEPDETYQNLQVHSISLEHYFFKGSKKSNSKLKYTSLIILEPRSHTGRSKDPFRQNNNTTFTAAVSCTAGPESLTAKCNKISVEVCPQHVSVLSVLFKNAYSCRNVLQRGNKRKMFSAMFDQQSKNDPKAS
jgi:hypothetical protein